MHVGFPITSVPCPCRAPPGPALRPLQADSLLHRRVSKAAAAGYRSLGVGGSFLLPPPTPDLCLSSEAPPQHQRCEDGASFVTGSASRCWHRPGASEDGAGCPGDPLLRETLPLPVQGHRPPVPWYLRACDRKPQCAVASQPFLLPGETAGDGELRCSVRRPCVHLTRPAPVGIAFPSCTDCT